MNLMLCMSRLAVALIEGLLFVNLVTVQIHMLGISGSAI